MSSDCSCNTGYTFGIVQCKSCNGTSCTSCNDEIRQKRIWNTVRVPASEYTMNIGSLNVYTKPMLANANVNWNQYSDRAVAGVVNRDVPSRGNSTRSSVTRDRPGSQSAAGKGVDIKHGSYARYLARLKGKSSLRTQNDTGLVPVEGNKTKKYGIAYSGKPGGCLCFV